MPKQKKAAAKKPRTKSTATAKPARRIPTAKEIKEAAGRASAWLGERDDYYGYLVRRSRRRGAPELASHLRGDLQAKQQRDGSWHDPDEEAPSLSLAAEALWQLMNLGLSAGSRAIDRGIDWINSRQGADGAFGEGSATARHITPTPGMENAFFSPGKSDEPQEAYLPNGQSVTSDAGARLLASERALRTVLRANPNDPRAIPSVQALRGLPLYSEYGGTFTPAVLAGALQALAWVPTPYHGEVIGALETLAKNQEKDGTWPNVEFFFVLEALLEVRHPLALRLMQKAIPRLMETQHKYGAWGRHYLAEQTWIGLSVLDVAAADWSA